MRFPFLQSQFQGKKAWKARVEAFSGRFMQPSCELIL